MMIDDGTDRNDDDDDLRSIIKLIVIKVMVIAIVINMKVDNDGR